MKTENLLLLGVAGFVLYEMTQGNLSNIFGGTSGTPYRYPPSPTGTGTGSRGGTTSGGGSGGGSGFTPGGGVSVKPGTPATAGILCDDGTLVNDPSLCTGESAGILCEDGTLVNDPSLCQAIPTPGYTQCMDGSYTDDPSTCLENQPFYPPDSNDPCDPSSMMYDPSQCGAPGDTQYDSGDPCDPYSYAYDENVCYGYL